MDENDRSNADRSKAENVWTGEKYFVVLLLL